MVEERERILVVRDANLETWRAEVLEVFTVWRSRRVSSASLIVDSLRAVSLFWNDFLILDTIMKIVPIDGMRAREQTVSLGEMEIRIKDEFTTEKVDRTTEERVWVNALEAEVVCFVRTCIREVTWVGVAGWSESEEGVGGGG